MDAPGPEYSHGMQGPEGEHWKETLPSVSRNPSSDRPFPPCAASAFPRTAGMHTVSKITNNAKTHGVAGPPANPMCPHLSPALSPATSRIENLWFGQLDLRPLPGASPPGIALNTKVTLLLLPQQGGEAFTKLFPPTGEAENLDSFRFHLKPAENRHSFCFHLKLAENLFFLLKQTPSRPSKSRDDDRRRRTEPLLRATFVNPSQTPHHKILSLSLPSSPSLSLSPKAGLNEKSEVLR
ncbi:hypothetical protein M5K25_023259 [Dendrobium thyrsiflorum]|uniref:Uncharacterized protein n=1 Tax=Dendrobium thyrsiflorum TaxID=117978 RepID=A0ABD0U8B4_DENTH